MSAEDQKPKQGEIVSLNKELTNFDFDDVTAEELERRLELALASLPAQVLEDCQGFSCGTNTGSGGTCQTFTCSKNNHFTDETE